jgi:hypothetical protein
VDLLNRLNNFVFRAGFFGENFLRLTPMDAPDRARLGKPPAPFVLRRSLIGPNPSFRGAPSGRALRGPVGGFRNDKVESPVRR